jgi:hypothetical protein
LKRFEIEILEEEIRLRTYFQLKFMKDNKFG